MKEPMTNITNLQSRRFLEAWKAAVKQLGPELFSVTSLTVDNATDRNDLRPDPEAITRHVMSSPENHHFLFAVVSFFSRSMIEDIFQEADRRMPALPDYRFLNDTQRKILFTLIENYETL
jgi:hypothetical protein